MTQQKMLKRTGECAERAHRGEQGLAGLLVDEGGVHVEDGVVKVSKRVRARARVEQLLALARAQERDVLHNVADALLVLLLVDRPHVHLEVRFKAPGGRFVGQDHIFEAVIEAAAHEVGARLERR